MEDFQSNGSRLNYQLADPWIQEIVKNILKQKKRNSKLLRCREDGKAKKVINM